MLNVQSKFVNVGLSVRFSNFYRDGEEGVLVAKQNSTQDQKFSWSFNYKAMIKITPEPGFYPLHAQQVFFPEK